LVLDLNELLGGRRGKERDPATKSIASSGAGRLKFEPSFASVPLENAGVVDKPKEVAPAPNPESAEQEADVPDVGDVDVAAVEKLVNEVEKNVEIAPLVDSEEIKPDGTEENKQTSSHKEGQKFDIKPGVVSNAGRATDVLSGKPPIVPQMGTADYVAEQMKTSGSNVTTSGQEAKKAVNEIDVDEKVDSILSTGEDAKNNDTLVIEPLIGNEGVAKKVAEKTLETDDPGASDLSNQAMPVAETPATQPTTETTPVVEAPEADIITPEQQSVPAEVEQTASAPITELVQGRPAESITQTTVVSPESEAKKTQAQTTQEPKKSFWGWLSRAKKKKNEGVTSSSIEKKVRAVAENGKASAKDFWAAQTGISEKKENIDQVA